MNHSRTPILDALLKHKSNKPFPYHVPGHKGGLVFTGQGRMEFKSILSLDVTELAGLDDLHAPEGPIQEAQMLLADLYQSRESYFLVNGTTVGNIAMIMAVCQEGDTVLVQRNCHKSILHGLMLANAKPVFLTPSFEEEWGVAGGADSSTVEHALSLYPEARAVILTYPNYYGMGKGISPIINLAHEKGIPVLVDEAHGAHFKLGSPFLNSSLDEGADIVVHSAHKTLPAMTMGSYLHVNSQLVDSEKVRFYLQMLQSSSPSYPIMASLDLARAYLASFSDDDKISLMEEIGHFREQLRGLPGLKVLQSGGLDPLKVTIRADHGVSGFELQKILENKGIFTELADTKNVLLVMPLLKAGMYFPFSETVEKIRKAMQDILPKATAENGKGIFGYGPSHPVSILELSYSEMKEKRKKPVPLKASSGLISAEMVTPYPPGVPLLMAGELITQKKVKHLEELYAKGSRFHGGSLLDSGKILAFE
ncbi:aminotransferase class I/II-fold pyridoxal phosphate-dependent enzyme [Peribacillus glennii]|uniref:Aminotransferase class I/II-fold pyridoxal phosphate-dependent enzyme n=1 Tax=Peribacillus glennii TaxID=2303991 RepID=A0A372LB78_9BACI|nr:aminotransferase class I/II-fold pyridoxal phosphate-dependent enzyme [Peribacillus glennii]RFU62623.1 aminotransferase class I/II-fold pyridoxal phosphate-dependent enzyme [Peribacillus glennii]